MGVSSSTISQLATSVEANPEFNSISTQVENVKNDLSNLKNELETVPPRLAYDTISTLELAMSRLYKIAVYIRGDFDNREDDEAQRKTLFDSAVSSFAECKEKADLVLSSVSNINLRVVDLQSNVIVPLEGQISTLATVTNNQIDTLVGQINSVSGSVDAMQRSYYAAQEAYNISRQKLAQAQQAANNFNLGVGIVASIFTFGLSNLAPPPAVTFGLQQTVDASRRNLEQASQNLNTTTNNLNILKNTKAQLEQSRNQQAQLRDRIPALSSTAANVKSDSVKMQQVLVQLKASSTQAYIKVRAIQDKATVTANYSITKQEFASGLLDVADEALIDSRLTDEVLLIIDEVINEYGAKVPNEISRQSKLIQARLANNDFSPRPLERC